MPRSLRPRLLSAAALVPVLLLTACGEEAVEVGEVGEEASASVNYVALGDSYAAMGSRSAALDEPPFCLRSADNYPSLVTADQTTDVSCQGAVVETVLGPRPTDGATLPPQVDALTPETTLVTLSVGGNDIGFGDISACILRAADSGQPTDCAAELEERIRAELAALPGELDELYRVIGERSPEAEVVATGYLPLVAAGVECPELSFVTPADRDWAAGLTAEINAVVEESAERNGAAFILPAGAGDHTVCAAPEQRWADITGMATDAYPMHPTAAGQAAMARAINER